MRSPPTTARSSEVAQMVGREVRDTDLLGKTEKGSLVARAARRGLRELDARHRPPRVAHRQLRLPHAAAHLGRRRLLPDARGRRRLAEAAGGLAAGGQLARRAVVAADFHFPPLRNSTMTMQSISILKTVVLAVLVLTPIAAAAQSPRSTPVPTPPRRRRARTRRRRPRPRVRTRASPTTASRPWNEQEYRLGRRRQAARRGLRRAAALAVAAGAARRQDHAAARRRHRRGRPHVDRAARRARQRR